MNALDRILPPPLSPIIFLSKSPVFVKERDDQGIPFNLNGDSSYFTPAHPSSPFPATPTRRSPKKRKVPFFMKGTTTDSELGLGRESDAIEDEESEVGDEVDFVASPLVTRKRIRR